MNFNACLVDELGKSMALKRTAGFDTRTDAQFDKIAVPKTRYQRPKSDIIGQLRDAVSVAGDTETDPLTGLPTRQQFLQRLEQCLQQNTCDGTRLALLVLELDHFKSVNDALGSTTGDKLLCRGATRICAKAPDALIVARTSGNGFGILVRECGDVTEVAAMLLDVLARPFALDGQIVTITASIGVSVTAADGTNASEIFHAAELALHRAQSDQQNCVRFFDPAMLERAERRRSLETDLRSAIAAQDVESLRALQTQQFAMLYQPKVRLSTGRVTGFEALLRWRHPELGQVSPDHFIPIAEETGLIDVIGEWALRTACHDAALWPVPDDGVPLSVAVNVSPLQLRNGAALVAAIASALSESGLGASQLEIELTESALVGDIGDTLAAIRRLGVGIALDDFGTGHSSLSRLHLYPFTRLKIDRSFVVALDRTDDLEAHRVSELMLRAIVSLGTSLGLETIVEGIETTAQVEIACRTGCTEMQGYFASAAVPTATVAAIVAQIVMIPCLSAVADGI